MKNTAVGAALGAMFGVALMAFVLPRLIPNQQSQGGAQNTLWM